MPTCYSRELEAFMRAGWVSSPLWRLCCLFASFTVKHDLKTWKIVNLRTDKAWKSMKVAPCCKKVCWIFISKNLNEHTQKAKQPHLRLDVWVCPEDLHYSTEIVQRVQRCIAGLCQLLVLLYSVNLKYQLVEGSTRNLRQNSFLIGQLVA